MKDSEKNLKIGNWKADANSSLAGVVDHYQIYNTDYIYLGRTDSVFSLSKNLVRI
jgi:hypothetical protein